MSIEQAKRSDAERISGVPNITFDMIAVLHAKLEAIAAYDIYKKDARAAGHGQAERFFDQCQQADRTMCQQLREMLAQNLQAGPIWTSAQTSQAPQANH